MNCMNCKSVVDVGMEICPNCGFNLRVQRKCFSLSNMYYNLGLDKAESEALLARLYEEVKRPEYHARFRWRKNSIAFWDNRAGLHYAVRDYGDFPRVMERVLIASDDIPHRVRRPA